MYIREIFKNFTFFMYYIFLLTSMDLLIIIFEIGL